MSTAPRLNRLLITTILLVVGVLLVFYVVQKIAARLAAQKNKEFHIEFSQKDKDAGFILLAPYFPTQPRFSYLMILSGDGDIIVQKRVEGIVSDLRQWIVNGNTRYSYAVYQPDTDPGDFIHGSMAHVMILDSLLNEIKQVHLLPYNDITPTQTNGIDHHDFLMLSDDHFITISSYVKEVSNIPDSLHPAAHVRVCAPIVQEILHDSVVWQWDATAFPEFYGASTKGNKFSDPANVQDYMHINGLCINPYDSNLVLSFHNTNQLINVDRRTGAIIWRLGGKNSDFYVSPEQNFVLTPFLRQHHPSFIDSGRTLLLFDNGDSTLRPASHILEFQLDQPARKIAYFKAYDIPEPFADSKGSVQVVGDNYFICGGSSNYILEVNRKTGVKKLEAHYNQTSFRAYLVPRIPGLEMQKAKK